MSTSTERFIPALGVDWLTPFYDVAARLVGERRFKRRLVALAGIGPGDDVLDLGCGTGTLALMVHRACPQARITGIDIDPRILAMARRKLSRAGVDVTLQHGSATAPPFPDGSFDRILTTLMLHHLSTEQKRQALAAAWRLLRPGGRLHIADFGKPHNVLMQIAATGVRLLDGAGNTAANLRGELPSLLAAAGFDEVAETERWMTPFGTLAFVSGQRSGKVARIAPGD